MSSNINEKLVNAIAKTIIDKGFLMELKSSVPALDAVDEDDIENVLDRIKIEDVTKSVMSVVGKNSKK